MGRQAVNALARLRMHRLVWAFADPLCNKYYYMSERFQDYSWIQDFEADFL